MDRLMKVGAVEFDTAGSDQGDAGFRYAGIADPQRLVHIVAQHSRETAHPQTGLQPRAPPG